MDTSQSNEDMNNPFDSNVFAFRFLEFPRIRLSALSKASCGTRARCTTTHLCCLKTGPVLTL